MWLILGILRYLQCLWQIITGNTHSYIYINTDAWCTLQWNFEDISFEFDDVLGYIIYIILVSFPYTLTGSRLYPLVICRVIQKINQHLHHGFIEPFGSVTGRSYQHHQDCIYSAISTSCLTAVNLLSRPRAIQLFYADLIDIPRSPERCRICIPREFSFNERCCLTQIWV